MKKIIAAVVACIVAVIAVFCFFNSDERQIIGTWYAEEDPACALTIYKDNKIESIEDGEVYESYNYMYEDHVLTLYDPSAGFDIVVSATVKVKGGKMYYTVGENTLVLYESYEEALKAHIAYKASAKPAQ